MRRPIIALMYDFDRTICTKDMQEYSFIPRINMSPAAFWAESNALAKKEKMDKILAYMRMMLSKASATNQPIRREDFVRLGKDLEYFPGVEAWFERVNRFAEALDVTVEHYIISSGLQEIIEGSSIFAQFRQVYACEFLYDVNGVACWPKTVVNYTTKTQFLFRINKGVLDLSNDDDLNKYTPEDDRPIPFRNMIYVGDGLTDVPCMRLVKSNGGYSIAVYQEGARSKVEELLVHERVNFLAPADYSEGGEIDSIVQDIIQKMVVVDRLKRKSMRQIASVASRSE